MNDSVETQENQHGSPSGGWWTNERTDLLVDVDKTAGQRGPTSANSRGNSRSSYCLWPSVRFLNRAVNGASSLRLPGFPPKTVRGGGCRFANRDFQQISFRSCGNPSDKRAGNFYLRNIRTALSDSSTNPHNRRDRFSHLFGSSFEVFAEFFLVVVAEPLVLISMAWRPLLVVVSLVE